MLLTEAEAREKWCPLARYGDVYDIVTGALVTSNRLTDGDAHSACRCIASACMAWQWLRGEGGPRRGYCGAFARSS